MQDSHRFTQIELISELIAKRHPATIRDLADLLANMEQLEEGAFLDSIRSMVKKGMIRLGPPSFTGSALDYLMLPAASGWFWMILIFNLVGALTILVVPETYPLSIIRWVVGSLLILLPGYTTIKLLFPRSDLLFLQRIALSCGITLVLVPSIGFILNFTPWGIRFLPITLSLSLYIILTAIGGVWREYLTAIRG